MRGWGAAAQILSLTAALSSFLNLHWQIACRSRYCAIKEKFENTQEPHDA
jgi:hypothetical protein